MKNMEKSIGLLTILFALSTAAFAQKKNEGTKNISVPAVVKSALHKKYADAKHVTWEKEKGNYEANWGGKSGEDNSVQFTPSGNFIEIVKTIPVSQLPEPVFAYVKEHYKGAKVTEAGKITDAQGKLSYEAEIKGKDVIFDEKGSFVKAE
jgi:hypothetical protein